MPACICGRGPSGTPARSKRERFGARSRISLTWRRAKKSSAEEFSPIVRVSTKNLEGAVEVRVRDNGSGIPANSLDKVFQPFFTTKPAGEGTGLGLSISYDVVVGTHQGKMRVESKEGEFAEFIITIPRV